ncbi:MAG: SUMF1/EgtB/PvdO family nonheme iron enzyme [Cyclobacteriaceae bacterium]|nr:SUMF1/EgtB/PvdO family nonheme iron enzyme [Cyclobacteriaceae bacterium]
MKKFYFLFLWTLLNGVLLANNIRVSNVSLSNTPNTTLDYTTVIFDIAWDNSWRTNVGPSNWDAAWIFVKYRLKNSIDWRHATLNWTDGSGSGDGHTVPPGAVISSSNDTGSGGSRGVFLYSSSVMPQGSVSYNGVELRWNYGVDGLSDDDRVEVAVFAIEMVYIPQGSFYVGDGNLTINGQFRIQSSNSPFQITSESPLTLGGGGATALHNNNGTGMVTPDDFNNTVSQTLPASFPKGYNAFYIMKYEISQEQYAEFLNKLTRAQQAQRFSSTTVGHFFGSGSTPANRNGIKLMSDPGPLSPRIYGNDLDNNGVAGEANDGQNIACNWLSSIDLLAYLDWAALRPMTELEYEKAARGTLTAVAGEYAWGSTVIVGATGISNSGANNEVASNAGANAVYNNAPGVNGPMRVGNFAAASTTRLQAGASYYGVMELSGNVWEDVVLVGSVAGRSYTGLHGNGALNANGQADVNFWPGINGNNTPGSPNGVYGGVTGCTGYAGISFTGGTWNNSAWMTISDRTYRGTGWPGINGRDTRNGGRGVRTAP